MVKTEEQISIKVELYEEQIAIEDMED